MPKTAPRSCPPSAMPRTAPQQPPRAPRAYRGGSFEHLTPDRGERLNRGDDRRAAAIDEIAQERRLPRAIGEHARADRRFARREFGRPDELRRIAEDSLQRQPAGRSDKRRVGKTGGRSGGSRGGE